MLAPLTGQLLVTQLHGSLRGGPSEAYSVVHGKTTYQCLGHAGVDFNAPEGSVVFAMKGGVLSIPPEDPWQDGYGFALGTYCVITLASGETHLYGHLSRILLPHGATVGPGQRFALSGNTGNSTGPHLHVAVRPPVVDYANHFDGTISFLDHFDHGVQLDLHLV